MLPCDAADYTSIDTRSRFSRQIADYDTCQGSIGQDTRLWQSIHESFMVPNDFVPW
jgi:hypothetical protein